VAEGKVIALTATGEKPASTYSGYAMLVVLLLAVFADAFAIYSLPQGPGGTLNVLTLIAATLAFILVMPGFYMLQPNQVAAITLFAFMYVVIYERLRPNSTIVDWIDWWDAVQAVGWIALLGVVLTMIPTLVLTRKYLKV